MSEIVRAGAVVLQGGEPRISSQAVADHFGKKHKNVLQAIDRLRVQAADMMREGDVTAALFHGLNFQPMFETVQIGNGATREDRAFSITEGAFMVLTMGFTGREALRLKILFIEEFKRMREALHDQNHAKTSKHAANRLPGALKAYSEWDALLSAWWKNHGGRRVVGSEVRALAHRLGLLESLFERCDTDRGRATAFGIALNARLDVQEGPFRVRKASPRNGYPTYRLAPAEGR